MVGSPATKARDGLIARLEDLVEESRHPAVEATQPADPPKLCAILRPRKRPVQNQ